MGEEAQQALTDETAEQASGALDNINTLIYLVNSTTEPFMLKFSIVKGKICPQK